MIRSQSTAPRSIAAPGRIVGKAWSLTSVVVCVIAASLAGAPPPAAANGGYATGPLILERIPHALRIDGELDEWAGTPQLLADRAETFVQVAGADPIQGRADIRVERLWVALGRQGLALAVEVTDDRVVAATRDAERLTSDHLELWVAFPAADNPPVQFSCEPRAEQPAQLDCAAWKSVQAAWERYVPRLFVHQYSISARGVGEHFATAAGNESFTSPFPSTVDLTGVAAVWRTTATGYMVEVLLPTSALPATAELPLRELRLLVDVVDNDRAAVGQESFLSLQPQRRFGDPSSFLPAVVETPLRWLAGDADLGEHLLSLRPRQPSTTIGNGGRFARLATVGTQLFQLVGVLPESNDPEPRPEGHPPWIGRISTAPLAPGRSTASIRSLAVLGEIELYLIEDGARFWRVYDGHLVPTHRLLTRRTGAGWLDSLPIGITCDDPDGPCTVVVRQRADGWAVILAEMTSSNPFGRGQCGSCPVLAVEVVEVSSSGELVIAVPTERTRQPGEPPPPDWTMRLGSELTLVPSALAGETWFAALQVLFPSKVAPETAREHVVPAFDLGWLSGYPSSGDPLFFSWIVRDPESGRYVEELVELPFDNPSR